MTFTTVAHQYIIRFDVFASQKHKSLILAAIGDKKKGCYVYLDAHDNPLYVGKSNDLVSRLKHHATPQGIECKIPDWCYLGIVLSDNPHLTEQELILQLQPRLNILGIKSKP